MNYYEQLGLKETATDQEIKQAHKKLSKKYHPDLNKEEGAEERFKQIQEAYEVLGDPQKRKDYDNQLHYQNFQQTRGGGFNWNQYQYNPKDIFNPFDYFRQEETKGRDVLYRMTIDLADCYTGTQRVITYQIKDAKGQDQVKKLKVRIPMGVTDGERLRLQGQGDYGEPHGDLLLEIKVALPSGYQREGTDLILKKKVTFPQLALGTDLTIKHQGTTYQLKVPRGSQTGVRLRMKNLGLPNRQNNKNGDLYVELHLTIPKKLTKEQRQLVEELRSEGM